MSVLKRNIALGLIVTSLGLTACSNPLNPAASATPQPTGQKYTVATGSIENTIVATGKIIPRQTADLVFSISGQVLTVTVAAGDQVKAGQLLASLDTTNLKFAEQQQYASYISARAAYSATVKGPSPSDLASAKSALGSAQAAYGDLTKAPSAVDVAAQKAALDNAQAALNQAQANYDRAFQKNPASIGGSAESLALQQATNNFTAAKAAYDKLFEAAKPGALASAASAIAAAKAKVDSLSSSDETVIQAKAKMDQAYSTWQQAKSNIDSASIYAPFDGIVSIVNASVGDFANTTSTSIEVVNMTRPLFEINVDEADVGNIRVGTNARVTLQAYNTTPLQAQVEKIAPIATVNGNVTTVVVDMALGGPVSGTVAAGQNAAGGAGQAGGANRASAIATSIAQGTPQANMPPAVATAIAEGTPAAAAFQSAFGGGQGTATGAGTGQRTGGAASARGMNILPGLSGTSEVIISSVSNVVVVPNAALAVDRATRGFTVEKVGADGKAVTTPVQVGLRGGSTTQITSGLSEGDIILVATASSTTRTGATGGQGGGAGAGGGIPFGAFGGR